MDQTCPACGGGVPTNEDRCPRCYTDMTRYAPVESSGPVDHVTGPVLSEDDRRRIYEEERARIDARQSLQQSSLSAQFSTGCFWLFVAMFGLGLIGYFVRPTGSPITQPFGPSGSSSASNDYGSTTTAAKDELEVLNWKWKTEEYGTRSITGTVRNNSSRTLGYAQVEINLYDETGNQVGSTMANVNNLQAGAKWNFEALVLEERATKAQIMRVSGF
jgi:hypothetical protein